MENLVVLAILVTLTVIFLSRKAGVKEIDPLVSEKTEDGAVVVRKFTPATLYKYNGFDTEQIYIAVRGTVYDVSKSRQFYGPSGPYNNFAGHDASRGLALNSFEMDVIRGIGEPIDTLDDLTPEDVKSLEGWEKMFRSKYPIVGTLVNEGKA